MNHEEVERESEKQHRFFDRLWPKRTLALILGLSMIAALFVPAALRANRAQPEGAEEQPAETPQETPQEAEPSGTQPAELAVFGEAFLIAYELSLQAMERGDYEAALKHAEDCAACAETREETVTALAQKSDMLFLLERYEEAENGYREIAERNDADLVSLSALNGKLARCQMLQNKLDEALISCGLALEQAADDAERADIYAVRGVVHFYSEAYAEAKADFEAALAAGYGDAELLRTQIEQCDRMLAPQPDGQPFAPTDSRAESGAGKTQQNDPPEPTEGEKNAAIYYFSGQFAQAAEEFRKLLGKSYYYTDMQLYSNIAKCQYLLGDFAGAAQSCTEGLAQKGDEERGALYTLRASAYMSLGESAQAAPDFEESLRYGVSDAKLNTLQAAICYYFSDNYEKCVALGEPLIDEPGYEEAALWVGFSKYMMGDLAAATDLLAKSVDLEQSFSRKDELYRIKARCEFQLGRYADAIASADSGIAVGSALTAEDRSIASELYYLRGAANLSMGQYDAARADLNSAMELGAENEYEVLSQLTLCEFLLGAYEDAASHGSRAMEIGGRIADLCYWVGLSQFSTEQFEQARSTLLACQELDPTKENIWFYLGVCSFSIEDYETAIQQFTASIEAGEPAADRSRYNRSICYLQREEYQKAKEDLETAAGSASADVASDAQELLNSLRTVLG